MATYFVRQSGNDSNAGTSAALAWRTLTKALGAAGISSGDTLYVGAGAYRELITVNMTSATVNTNVIGDIDGAQTGDVGEVILTGYLQGDWSGNTAGANINLNGRDFLTFQYLTMISGGGPPLCINATTVASTDIVFRDCNIYGLRPGGAGAATIDISSNFGQALNWTIERCRIFAWVSSPINVGLTTGVGADYDANVQVRDCIFFGPFGGSTAAVAVGSIGTSANEGGGVDMTNCTVIGGGIITTSGTRVGGATFAFPCVVTNCLGIAGSISSVLSAGELGAVTDGGWNRLCGQNGYTNVTAVASSRASSIPSIGLNWGQDPVISRVIRPWSEPLPGSPSNSFGPTVRTTDFVNRPRPEGCILLGDSGTASSGATTSITDIGKVWGVDQWKGWMVKTTGGTGANQFKRISSNTATALTISGAANAGGLWATTPASGTTYQIYMGPQVETGKSTAAGTTTTLTDGGANWNVNGWGGHVVAFTGGTGNGQTAVISSNTATVLTFAAVTTAPDATTTYSIYPSGSVDDPQPAVGAYERHDNAVRETGTTDAGGVAICINGRGSHEFLLPVENAATVVTIKARYNSDHGTTNKPQAILVANGECGVSAQTLTMTAAADTWETLSFSSFTPTAKGVVAVRLVSRSAKALGKAFFDSWTVT